MTTYKELRMITNAGNELRTKIRNGLSLQPDTSGGEINCIDIDPDTGDLIVTAEYTGGQRVHRLIIKDEGPGPAAPLTQEGLDERVEQPKFAHEIMADLKATLGRPPTQAEWDAHMLTVIAEHPDDYAGSERPAWVPPTRTTDQERTRRVMEETSRYLGDHRDV